MELPTIAPDANKYSRGSLLIIAGSARYPGAAVLAALAAERAGAGYTTLAVPASVAPVAWGHLLSVPVIAAPEDSGTFAADALPAILGQLRPSDAILAGPGLTATAATRSLLADLLAAASCPLVLDADALNLLAGAGQDSPAETSPAGQGALWQSLPAGTVLTPHGGELTRLLKATGTDDAATLAKRTQTVVVAKGPVTTVYSPSDAVTPFVYRDGTPGLAKAGSGDVLAGIIASLAAQGATPWQAAVSGVELHGRAGRLAETNGSRRSMTAHDIIETIAMAFREVDDN